MKTRHEQSPLSPGSPQDFLQELAHGNLPRMWWLLLTSTSLSLLMALLNGLVFRRMEFAPWQILDLSGSAIFFGLFWLAKNDLMPAKWVWPLSPAYFAFWLVLMDGYYFAGMQMNGDITAYVLGALAPAILIIQPPRVFLFLLIPNHLVFCAMTLFPSPMRRLENDIAFSALLNGTLGVMIAGLGAWFLYSATKATYERTRQVWEKTSEAKLAASHLQAILENIPFQAWLKDTDGKFLAVNRGFAEGTRLSAGDIVGRSSWDIYPADRAMQYTKEDKAILQTKDRVYFEESIEGPAGKQWFEVFKSPVLTEAGVCVGTAGLARDITERKAIEDRLLAADTAKSEFLATMSHEIRTPMNSVLGYAELLRETSMDSVQKEYVASINHSGQLLLAVINAILDFSKMEAGKISLLNEVFSLPDLLNRMVGMFKPLADQKGLTFRVGCGSDVPTMLIGDATRVEQLLVNLLSNAVKFTEEGEVKLDVAATHDPEGDYDWRVSFAVTDTGIGIPPEQVERLFKPFSQIDSAMARRFSGTGLGLVIVERLCQLMDGTISVESRSGRGSSFMAVIGLMDAAGARPARETDVNPAIAEVDVSTCRVLVVEDNASNRRLMTTLLRRWKIEPVVVEGGEEALREVRLSQFDLILMDVQMPGMDGLQATRLIRKWEAAENRPRVQIVALTAFALADDSAKCIEAGMDDYLSKPVNLAALRRAVARAAGSSKRAAS